MVLCIVRNTDGNELGHFVPMGKKPLLSEALDAGIEIPYACRAGMCLNCACRITCGWEFVVPERFGEDFVEAGRDIALTCIAGVRKEAIASGEQHVIELQAML